MERRCPSSLAAVPAAVALVLLAACGVDQLSPDIQSAATRVSPDPCTLVTSDAVATALTPVPATPTPAAATPAATAAASAEASAGTSSTSAATSTPVPAAFSVSSPRYDNPRVPVGR